MLPFDVFGFLQRQVVPPDQLAIHVFLDSAVGRGGLASHCRGVGEAAQASEVELSAGKSSDESSDHLDVF